MREISDRDILKICYLYYKEDQTQEQISGLLGYSRFKISRILKEARKRGLVTVTIHDPMIQVAETETELAKTFGLDKAIVVRVNQFSHQSGLDQVGKAGAQYLREILNRYHIFGVTWGHTVYHVVNELEPVEARESESGADRRRTRHHRGHRQQHAHHDAWPETRGQRLTSSRLP